MVEFRRINDDNFDECINLKVAKEQSAFVPSNLQSLADGYIILTNGGHAKTHAIYVDNVMVGLIQYGCIDERGKDCYYIWRLMIDKNHQGNGYGKQAVAKVMDKIKSMPFGLKHYINVLIEPENIPFKNLFKSFRFMDMGRDSEYHLLQFNI